MTKKTKNGTIIADSCTQRIEGLREHVSSKAEIAINGKSYKLAQLITIYQQALQTRSTLKSKRGEVKVALLARDEAEASRQGVDDGLKAWVFGQFGANSQAAHDIGYLPAKVAVKSVEVKYEAVQQAAATRAAGGAKAKKENSAGAAVASTEPAAPATTTQAAAPSAAGVPANGATTPHP